MKYILFFTAMLLMFTMNSCYYDNMEDLYPETGNCDTTIVTFSAEIWPILESNCYGCHSGSAPSGNISIENYNDVTILVENGKLMGTIRHETGFSPMPKASNKLSDCNVTKIETWVNAGYPEN